jgi:hypothetical protein
MWHDLSLFAGLWLVLFLLGTLGWGLWEILKAVVGWFRGRGKHDG